MAKNDTQHTHTHIIAPTLPTLAPPKLLCLSLSISFASWIHLDRWRKWMDKNSSKRLIWIVSFCFTILTVFICKKQQQKKITRNNNFKHILFFCFFNQANGSGHSHSVVYNGCCCCCWWWWLFFFSCSFFTF